MFLLSQALPDFGFLMQRRGIPDMQALKEAAEDVFNSVDLKVKRRDFEHLLFHPENSARILHCREFFRNL
jgi:hypothetical protein